MNRLRFVIRALQALEENGDALESAEVSGLKDILDRTLMDLEGNTK